MGLPVYKGSGTFTAGTVAITPPMPTAGAAPVADDVLVLACESENQPITLSTPAGFVEILNSPQGTGSAGVAGSTRLSAFWKRAVGGDTAPTVADSGDHTTGQIHCVSGCKLPPASSASDDFSRADNADLGTNWSAPTGATVCKIVSNSVRATSLSVDSDEYYDGGISWPANQYSELVVTDITATGFSGPAVRRQTGDRSGYVVECSSAGTTLYRFDTSGVGTSIGTAAAVAAGSVMRLAAVGSTFILFDDGVPIIAVSDTTGPASGKPGIHCYEDSAGTGRIGGWAGGGNIAPWNVTAGGVDTVSDVSAAVPGATTTADNCLVMLLYSSSNDATSTTNFSGHTNADLGSLTERTDNTNTVGLGGGHGMATGTKAAAGSYTTTAVTYSVASLKGMLSIALEGTTATGWLAPDLAHTPRHQSLMAM